MNTILQYIHFLIQFKIPFILTDPLLSSFAKGNLIHHIISTYRILLSSCDWYNKNTKCSIPKGVNHMKYLIVADMQNAFTTCSLDSAHAARS